MAHYLAVHHYDLDEGTKAIHVYKNKRGGIFWVDSIYIYDTEHVMEFTEVIKRVREELKFSKNDDSSINVEGIVR